MTNGKNKSFNFSSSFAGTYYRRSVRLALNKATKNLLYLADISYYPAISIGQSLRVAYMKELESQVSEISSRFLQFSFKKINKFTSAR